MTKPNNIMNDDSGYSTTVGVACEPIRHASMLSDVSVRAMLAQAALVCDGVR